MRSPAYALAWEFYSANRRGWLIVLGAIPLCALVYRLFAGQIHDSDTWRTLTFLPFVISLILAVVFCNFTDRSHRNGLAGFPQHLFTLPLKTRYLVSCVMTFALVSVTVIYVSWAKIVFEPLGIRLWIRWPLTLLTVGIVVYQTIIWSLSGFRLTRVIVLSLAITILVGVGVFSVFWEDTGGNPIEGRLTAGLAGVAVIAFAATILTVDAQRRGGARGWQLVEVLADVLSHAAPISHGRLKTAGAALIRMELQRNSLVLPAAVLLATILILGPILWLTGRGPDATIRAVFWLLALPIVMTLVAGKGMSKPDFWSLDLSLSPFFITRPITGAQIVAAKMKAAAVSAIAAWTILFTIAPAWIFATCDVRYLRDIWRQFQLVYSPLAEVAIPLLIIAAVVLITWSVLVASIWVGHSGRYGLFYTVMSLTAAVLISLMIAAIWGAENPRQRAVLTAEWLPRLPWILAAVFGIKVWLAACFAWLGLRRQLICRSVIFRYLSFWLAATVPFIVLAWQISPRVAWLRESLILAALLVIPLARIAAAPLTIAANRNR